MSEPEKPEVELLPPELPPLPAKNLNDALVHLRRPFTAGAIKWKIQASGPKGAANWAIVIGYIDARLVVERLNMVCGSNWSEKPTPVEGQSNALLYELTLAFQSGGPMGLGTESSTHTDVGIGQGSDDGMKLKGMHSDALKRVAVRFGVGVSLYAMPQMFLKVTPSEEVIGENEPTLLRLQNGKPGRLKVQHEEHLRRLYQAWLDGEGGEAFGAPLDHGDARTGSTGGLAEGLAAEDEPETVVEVGPEPLIDMKADELRAAIKSVHAELGRINPNRLTEGRRDDLIKGAEHSHDRLGAVLVKLEDLRDTENVISLRIGELTALVGKKEAKPIIDRAKRRGSQRERISVLEKAIAEATPSETGGKSGDE